MLHARPGGPRCPWVPVLTPLILPPLGLSYCVQELQVFCMFLSCALLSLVPERHAMCMHMYIDRYTQAQGSVTLFCFPGIVPTVCSAEVTQNEPVPTVHSCPLSWHVGQELKSVEPNCLRETTVRPFNKTLGFSCFTCEVGVLIASASSGVSITGLSCQQGWIRGTRLEARDQGEMTRPKLGSGRGDGERQCPRNIYNEIGQNREISGQWGRWGWGCQGG